MGVDVSLGGCPGEAWINADQRGPVLFNGLGDPLEGDGVILGCIAADNEDAITILEIVPVIGHCTSTERLCQSRNSSGVSYARLVFDVHQAQRSHCLDNE